MSKASSSSPPVEGGANPNHQGTPEDAKPRLTEEEKKQNHIASEQKRREAIRAGFDRLCEIVPGLEGQGRSEGLVLKKTVDYIGEQLAQRRELVARLEREGHEVPQKYRDALKSLAALEEHRGTTIKPAAAQNERSAVDGS